MMGARGISAGGVPVRVIDPIMSAACDTEVADKTPIKKANEKAFTVHRN
jgi:hypothetical protein